MGLKTFFLKFFTWWNGQTFGTQLFTWRHGQRVGEDAEGNVFYQNADGSRRWVIYNGEAEASRVGPEWHGWLHHTWQEPPTKAPLAAPALGEAARAQHDRQRARLPAAREHARRRPAGARRLRGLGAGIGDGAMANSVAEAVIGAVVLATAAGFVVYAGQSRGLQVGGEQLPAAMRASAARTGSPSAPTCGSPASTWAPSPGSTSTPRAIGPR